MFFMVGNLIYNHRALLYSKSKFNRLLIHPQTTHALPQRHATKKSGVVFAAP